ncbi:UDP-N-acetylmuramate dehydrogenase [Legionella geestiana]|uniref:UDP-N-acetylmuramate dehydrogenase n=1 Tax=Legionella geestiana TaxID=45065 RepID=UPI00048B140C|nr:UDP-N-acetylmuramate dehydrogenase [Legionella geestiana]QBS13394.1 UDP-N-acetylmuramate dehydrogenase [Legionella geestiana]
MERSPLSESGYEGVLLLKEPLAGYTTWRVGGEASRLYKPASINDLSRFLARLPKEEPLVWLGLGSNSLIRDSGFEGTVILTQGCLRDIALVGEGLVRVEAGVSCASMARFCARNNLEGGEFWAGIPGTMGGALRMNAGCFGHETWEFVVSVETMTRDGQRHTRTPADFDIAYRHVRVPDNEWFVAATCSFSQGEKAASLEKIRQLLEHRANTQPTSEYNCGSVFRNPPGTHAARLIESCGLKGKRLGGARVSEKHANFIINHEGTASAADIESLIVHIREAVHAQTGIELITEVHILGE